MTLSGSLSNAINDVRKEEMNRPSKIVQLYYNPTWKKNVYLDDNGNVWVVESKGSYSYWFKCNADVRDAES